MSQPLHSKIQAAAPPSAAGPRIEEIFSFSERMLLPCLPESLAGDPVALAGVLLSQLGSPWEPREVRERASHFVARLAERIPAVLRLLVAQALAYAEYLRIDDSDPFTPCVLDALAEIGAQNDCVASFLRRVMGDDRSFAVRRAGTEILSAIDDCPAHP